MELWICVSQYQKMQIPTISIMDDFYFDGLGVVHAQKIGRYSIARGGKSFYVGIYDSTKNQFGLSIVQQI